jgi:hypothetical protein
MTDDDFAVVKEALAKCTHCYGGGRIFMGWSAGEKTYEQCAECEGSGLSDYGDAGRAALSCIEAENRKLREALDGSRGMLRHAHDRLIKLPEFEAMRVSINRVVRGINAALDGG